MHKNNRSQRPPGRVHVLALMSTTDCSVESMEEWTMPTFEEVTPAMVAAAAAEDASSRC